MFHLRITNIWKWPIATSIAKSINVMFVTFKLLKKMDNVFSLLKISKTVLSINLEELVKHVILDCLPITIPIVSRLMIKNSKIVYSSLIHYLAPNANLTILRMKIIFLLNLKIFLMIFFINLCSWKKNFSISFLKFLCVNKNFQLKIVLAWKKDKNVNNVKKDIF